MPPRPVSVIALHYSAMRMYGRAMVLVHTIRKAADNSFQETECQYPPSPLVSTSAVVIRACSVQEGQHFLPRYNYV
jgi:hypothetical protein